MKPKDIVAAIAQAGEELPRSVVRAVHANGKAMLPVLEKIVDDPARYAGRTSGGFARYHAIYLLGALEDPRSKAILLRALTVVDPELPEASAAIESCAGLGPDAIDDLLALTVDDQRRQLVDDALATMGVQDPRIAERLRAGLKVEPVLYAMLCHDYGDPSFLPDLLAAFDTATDIDAAAELAEAIGGLGGALSEEQQRHLVTLIGEYQEQHADENEVADEDEG
jgi:hypothetical protein